MRGRTVLGLVLAAAGLLGPAGGRDAAAAPPETAPDPNAVRQTQAVDEAIRRGVEHLVDTQKKDGSWGSPAGNLYDIYAPGPGSYHTFQAAVTAMAVSALLEAGGDRPGVAEAVRRGTDFLLQNRLVKRISTDTIYNVWAHAYTLETCAKLLPLEQDEARRKAILATADDAVDRIRRYECLGGGWSYYDFDFAQPRPGPNPGATSFTTASVLVSLAEAEKAGIAVPEGLVDRGVKILESCRMPLGAFSYSYRHRLHPHGGINKVKGSLARTPACLLALERSGRPVEEAKVRTALDNLETYGRFLLIARKYPRPHETWYQNSGYFCFYGYYYASLLMETLPEERRCEERKRLASHLVPLQEQDGSFWDYQLYGYHKAYGTSYVLMTLARCR